jgi:uncharacterized protein with NRDE domain
MCTLIVIYRCVPGAPLVVAANRDEYFDRPAAGPALRQTPVGPIICPLDLRAGGTWLGLGPQGVFAGVTNLKCTDPDPDRRSRGLLVCDALAAGSAREAADVIGSLPERGYNPFNFLVADAESAFLVTYRDTPRLRELGTGVHVVGNIDPEGPETPKVSRVREGAERAATQPREQVLDALASLCREHGTGGGGLGDTCVHLGEYGTRSSALFMLTDADCDKRFLFAEGPPCRNEYRNYTPLLHEQSSWTSDAAGETASRIAS